MHVKSMSCLHIYLATSNPGKVRDFQAAAANLGIEVQILPGFQALPQAIEDGATFEDNARIKAEHYSRLAPGILVVADDSGLAVDWLNGAPGVYSARYAAIVGGGTESHLNSDDEQNNQTLIQQLEQLPPEKRSGRFVCVIAVARDGTTLKTFCGEAQ